MRIELSAKQVELLGPLYEVLTASRWLHPDEFVAALLRFRQACKWCGVAPGRLEAEAYYGNARTLPAALNRINGWRPAA